MFRKLVIILIMAVLIGLGLNLRLMYAQRYYEQESEGLEENLSLIAKKLDIILALLEKKSNEDVLDRLERILQSQVQIGEELKVIKVRASR